MRIVKEPEVATFDHIKYPNIFRISKSWETNLKALSKMSEIVSVLYKYVDQSITGNS